MKKISLNKFKDCIVDEKNNIVAEKPRWFDKHKWEQGEMLVEAFNKNLNFRAMYEKELLIELCDNLEKKFNQREGKQTHKVELQSGLKPESYFTPMIHIGTTRTLPDGVRMAWFVEVWVDDKCIIREACVPHETESLKIVEGILISRVLRHIFTFGVMSSKKFIDEHVEI